MHNDVDYAGSKRNPWRLYQMMAISRETVVFPTKWESKPDQNNLIQKTDETVTKRNHSQLMVQLLSGSMSFRGQDLVSVQVCWSIKNINSAQLPIHFWNSLWIYSDVRMTWAPRYWLKSFRSLKVLNEFCKFLSAVLLDEICLGIDGPCWLRFPYEPHSNEWQDCGSFAPHVHFLWYKIQSEVTGN